MAEWSGAGNEKDSQILYEIHDEGYFFNSSIVAFKMASLVRTGEQ